ncbi:DEKNAAC105216 [Brettanomyces naardenensis]|uniref:DEKNAAC105216 n=1 Tax=Brettanomyces naardenensis TaxID=13370 RepID=A0A448YT28_BRENA|nr:DEKNAAC105216 [Brettanomyces naardenensis]
MISKSTGGAGDNAEKSGRKKNVGTGNSEFLEKQIELRPYEDDEDEDLDSDMEANLQSADLEPVDLRPVKMVSADLGSASLGLARCGSAKLTSPSIALTRSHSNHGDDAWHNIQPDSSALSNSSFEDPSNYPDGGWRAYLVVFGAFLGLTVSFGFINSIGAIQSYTNLHQLKDVSTSKSSYIFAIFLLLTYIVGVVAGVAFDELGPRIPLMYGTCVVFFGLFFTGSCNSVGSFVGVFGVLAGMGVGFCGAPLTGAISHWFYKNRSKAFALATLGGSVGGIAFPLLLNRLYIVVGFKWALRILAFVCLALMLVCISLVSGRKDKICPPEKKSSDRIVVGQTRSKQIGRELWVLCKKTVDFTAFKELPYLLCTLGIGLSDLSLVCTLTYFPSYITYIGYSETKANTCITIINALGILGRYLPGILADKIGPYNVMIVMMIITCLSVFILWLGWSMESPDLTSIYVFTVIYGFFDSAVLSLAPCCIAAVSPTREFGKRYGTSYLVAGLFVFGGTIAGGAIISEESLQHYRYFAIFCGALYAASVVTYVAARFYQVGWKVKTRV